MHSFYSTIGRFIPKRIVKGFKREMEYLDINVPEMSFVGFLFLYGLLLSIGIAANMFFFFRINFYTQNS